MMYSPKETILIVTAIAGYVEYSDASKLFLSLSNRNRVIKELKDVGFISVVSSNGLRTINLLKAGREYVSAKYPDIKGFTHYTGDMQTKKRRCVIGKLLINMARWDIPFTDQTDTSFLLKMDGAGTDRGYRLGRMVGIYNTPHRDYLTYQLGEKGITWNDRREASQNALILARRAKETAMLVVADQMAVLSEILENTDFPMKEKELRRKINQLKIHLPDGDLPVFFVGTEDFETAKLEMDLLADQQWMEIFQTVFGSHGESVLIPLDARKLYGVWKCKSTKTVYVQEGYASYIRNLCPWHEVVGVPLEGMQLVMKGV